MHGEPGDGDRTAELAQRYSAVRTRLDEAESAAGRAAGSVRLMVVTKFFPAADVRRLLTLGVRTFGESREPEAGRKVDELAPELAGLAEPATFDMIGSVQTKKAKSIAGWADTVHSVDRTKVLDALSRATLAALEDGRRTSTLGVLLQVSLDGDPHRGGVPADELPQLAEDAAGAEGIDLRGLMVIAPVGGDPDRWMSRAQEIASAFRDTHPGAIELSAGMSGDLEQAVRHGSTCVRVGTAIMGARPLLSQ